MARYRISQLAERVGVPATTLRYYETQGLMATQRTAGGYRTYDDHDVERVRFIVTAKKLRLPLTRIRDLLGVWQGGMCRDVRVRLLPLVANQIDDLDKRIDDLRLLGQHLTDARKGLRALPSRDAPCDPECAFLTGPTSTSTGTPPAAEPSAPIACSLSGADHTARLKTWHAALSGTVSYQLSDGTIRTELPTARLADVGALIADEVTCCPFFRFSLTITHDGAQLDATAPAEARPLLGDLFPSHRTEGHQC
ncbi:MerR family transcriptional regulator [Pseudonocardia tropica]|uniref:MerR family transcriptional regulator n=1 Tax=Pseudonocardia tropica TaxID=681289 RepID=A0ABV1JQB5_9PSEU